MGHDPAPSAPSWLDAIILISLFAERDRLAGSLIGVFR